MKKLFLFSALLISTVFNCLAQSTDSLTKKASAIKIRSLKKPIYSIDGIKQEASEFAINSLDPDSIAEIKILKNDDAVKLFGIEALDGVILITTRSGKNNAANLDLEQKLNLISGGKESSKITNLKIYGTQSAVGADSTVSLNNRSKIIIRGLQQSANSLDDVVYILDGQKIEKDAMSWINPNSIQSISVLKDKNTIAQYGPQASNGVIIITTKPLKIPKVQEKPIDKN